MKNKLKDLAIFILIILSIAQTGRLWFGVNVGYNLIYALRNIVLQEREDYAEKGALAAPYRVISKVGDNDFRIKYNNLDSNIGRISGDMVLEELFQTGEFLYSARLDWDRLLSSPCLIYDYSINIDANMFAECFAMPNAKQFKNFTDHINMLDCVIFAPPEEQGSRVTVVFVNSILKMAYAYNVDMKKQTSDNLRLYIEGAASGLSYISATADDVTAQNVFIPNFVGNGFAYHPLRTHNPYASQSGVRTIKSVEAGVLTFFDETSVQVEPDEASYRYSNNANVVVRYNFTNEVIEYSNYSAVNKQNDNSLANNFAAAIRFINADPNVKNDFYLAKYQADGDRTTFYFSYAIADLPLFLPDSVKAETGLSHAIEITSENQKITKYKRLALTFVADENLQEVAQVTYEDFYAAIGEAPEGELRGVKDSVRLGYKYDRGLGLYLNWLMESGGRSYIVPA